MSTSHPRRRFSRPFKGAVTLVAATLLLAACGGGDDDAGSTDTGGTSTGAAVHDITVGMLVGGPVSALLVAADQEGIFEANGLNVEMFESGSGSEMLAASSAGDVDVFGAPINLVASANAQQECFTYLSPLVDNYYNLVGSPSEDWPNAGKGLDAIKDLEGKTVGVTTRGGGTEIWVRVLLDEVGVDPSTVTFVAVGGLPTAIPAFENNQVNVLVSFPPVETVLGEGGFEMIYKTIGDPNTPVSDALALVMAAPCSWVEENEEAAIAVCQAMSDAADFAVKDENQEAMGRHTTTLVGDDDVLGPASWKAMRGAVPQPFTITPEVWDAQETFLAEELRGTVGAYEDVVFGPCQEL